MYGRAIWFFGFSRGAGIALDERMRGPICVEEGDHSGPSWLPRGGRFQEAIDPCSERVGVKRFDKVVVCAIFQGLLDIVLVGVGSKHDHRHVVPSGLLANVGEQLKAAEVGEHNIPQYQVWGRDGVDHVLGLASIGCMLDLAAVCPQQENEQTGGIFLIFDHEDGRRSRCLSRCHATTP